MCHLSLACCGVCLCGSARCYLPGTALTLGTGKGNCTGGKTFQDQQRDREQLPACVFPFASHKCKGRSLAHSNLQNPRGTIRRKTFHVVWELLHNSMLDTVSADTMLLKGWGAYTVWLMYHHVGYINHIM